MTQIGDFNKRLQDVIGQHAERK